MGSNSKNLLVQQRKSVMFQVSIVMNIALIILLELMVVITMSLILLPEPIMDGILQIIWIS